MFKHSKIIVKRARFDLAVAIYNWGAVRLLGRTVVLSKAHPQGYQCAMI